MDIGVRDGSIRRMTGIYYRLSRNEDPEERLEDAAMWKALRDEYGEDITLLDDEDGIPPDAVFFGRLKKGEWYSSSGNSEMAYWNDPAFLRHSIRRFETCDFKEAGEVVAEIHASGKHAFVKAMERKTVVDRIPIGMTLPERFGDLCYSYIDRGKCLLVQEFAQIEYEQRFLFIERELATKSPIAWHLTPLDTYVLPAGAQFRTPFERYPEVRPDLDLEWLARKVAAQCKYDCVGIDCAYIDGKPGVVEFNDMHVGQMGLYACDVRALARATRWIVARSATPEFLSAS